MTKNTLILAASFAALFAVGCSGDDEPKDSGDTGTGDDDDDDTVAPLDEFDDATLAGGMSCAGTSVDFEYDFLGESSGGWIDMADTANVDSKYGNWNETHSLLASGVTDDGGLTVLDATGITTGADLTDWADGVSTVFRCDYHFESAGTMTYIARSYDFSAVLQDCVAWGDDPSGFISGTSPSGLDYADDNARPDAGDFAGCRTAAAAR